MLVHGRNGGDDLPLKVNSDGELVVSGVVGGGSGDNTAVVTAIEDNAVTTGTAGAPSTDVLTVQGISGGTPLDIRLGGNEYETVAASQTNQALGATGAQGDYLECLVCVVSTAATSQVQIKDGANTAITVLPNNAGGGIGTYHVSLGLTSRAGAWQITTGAGVSVLATGNFT